jgi:serine/threonine protein phosphatase PrpC
MKRVNKHVVNNDIDTQLGPKKAPVNASDVPAALSRAFCQLDAAYIKHCIDVGEEAGSTAVIALLNKVTHHLFVANVGDARCIIGTPNGSAEALSIDHKPMVSARIVMGCILRLVVVS